MADSLTDKVVDSSSRPVPRKIRLPFTYFLALRYLKPKRTFLSLITLISILGVVLGISVLIIVISVMTGFERELQRKIIGFDADVLISGNEVMNNWREILDRTKKTPGVVAAAPFAQGRVIVQFQNHRAVPWLRGIDPDLEQSVANLKQFLVAGDVRSKWRQRYYRVGIGLDPRGQHWGYHRNLFAPRHGRTSEGSR